MGTIADVVGVFRYGKKIRRDLEWEKDRMPAMEEPLYHDTWKLLKKYGDVV